MIIWSGRGFLVAVIAVGALLLTQLVVDSISGDENFYQKNSWPKTVAMLVAALLTFGLHKLLSQEKPKVLIDQETGQEFEIHGNHSLFYIHVKWWPFIFVILGIFSILVSAM